MRLWTFVVLCFVLAGYLNPQAGQANPNPGAFCTPLFQAPDLKFSRSVVRRGPPAFQVLLSKADVRELFNASTNPIAEWLRQNSRLPSASDFAALKDLRKRLLILESGFRLFDEKQRMPDHLGEFTKTLGKLNDALEFQAEALIPKLLKEVEKEFRPGRFLKEIESFQPAKRKQIRRRVADIERQIRNTLDRSDVTVHDFHEMRGQLKNLLALTQLLAYAENPQANPQANLFLIHLNEVLGGMRQGILRKEIELRNQGISGNFDELHQNIPAYVRQAILHFLDQFYFEI